MAALTELRMVLYRIRQQLVAHPVFTRGTGVPLDDPAHDRELEELDRLSLQLSLLLRELKNASNLLDARRQGLGNVPREDRYRAAASLQSKQADVSALFSLAREIQGWLEDLLRKSGLLGEGEMAQGIGELIEKLYHQAHTHGEVHNMPDGLSYTSPTKGEFGGSLEGVTILVFVALRAFLYAAKRGAAK